MNHVKIWKSPNTLILKYWNKHWNKHRHHYMSSSLVHPLPTTAMVDTLTLKVLPFLWKLIFQPR